MAEKQQVKQHYPKIKEMYLNGVPALKIAEELKLTKCAIYNAISNMYLPRRQGMDESKLVYADNRVVLQKVVIYGKRYIDVTPIFAPR